MISSSFICSASVSRFCVFWIRNTMRKVTIVVPVLITNCHVSEKPKRGPVAAHSRMTATAAVNVTGLPLMTDADLANREKYEICCTMSRLTYIYYFFDDRANAVHMAFQVHIFLDEWYCASDVRIDRGRTLSEPSFRADRLAPEVDSLCRTQKLEAKYQL